MAEHDGPGQLTGFRIVLLCPAEHLDEQRMLERRGACVLRRPTVEHVDDERGLASAARAIAATPPAAVVVGDGGALYRWLQLADAEGEGERVRASLRRSRVWTTCLEATGAALAEDLCPVQLCGDQRIGAVAGRILLVGLTPRAASPFFDEALPADGNPRLVVVPSRSVTARPGDELTGTVDCLTGGEVDLLAATSVEEMDALARAVRAHEGLESGPVLDGMPAVVPDAPSGRVAQQLGATPLVVTRPGAGALVAGAVQACGHLVRRARTRRGPLEIRGTGVVLEGTWRPLGEAPLALLRTLAAANGAVVPRDQLVAPDGQRLSRHAVDQTVSRLRRSLGDDLVLTVPRRGHRLASMGTAAPGLR